MKMGQAAGRPIPSGEPVPCPPCSWVKAQLARQAREGGNQLNSDAAFHVSMQSSKQHSPVTGKAELCGHPAMTRRIIETPDLEDEDADWLEHWEAFHPETRASDARSEDHGHRF